MKANRGQIERALSAPTDEIRLFLLYGPDQSGSEALAALLGRAMGDEAERIDLSSAELKSDPARLADEAASISLFGGKRWIRVEAAGDDVFAAAEALIETEQAGNPVVIVAGALRATSKLVKLALASKRAMVFASYAPEGRDADRLVIEMGHPLGLQIGPDAARRIAAASNGDRAILASELEKFALYLDAAADRPRKLEEEAFEAIGAASEEGDLGRFANLVLSGELPALDAELKRLENKGISGIPLVRVLLRKLLMLARLRAEVDQGSSVQSVIAKAGRAIFWKEKGEVTRQLRLWKSAALATAIERAQRAERTLKSSGGPGLAAANDDIFAIARHARRVR